MECSKERSGHVLQECALAGLNEHLGTHAGQDLDGLLLHRDGIEMDPYAVVWLFRITVDEPIRGDAFELAPDRARISSTQSCKLDICL